MYTQYKTHNTVPRYVYVYDMPTSDDKPKNS